MELSKAQNLYKEMNDQGNTKGFDDEKIVEMYYAFADAGECYDSQANHLEKILVDARGVTEF